MEQWQQWRWWLNPNWSLWFHNILLYLSLTYTSFRVLLVSPFYLSLTLCKFCFLPSLSLPELHLKSHSSTFTSIKNMHRFPLMYLFLIPSFLVTSQIPSLRIPMTCILACHFLLPTFGYMQQTRPSSHLVKFPFNTSNCRKHTTLYWLVDPSLYIQTQTLVLFYNTKISHSILLSYFKFHNTCSPYVLFYLGTLYGHWSLFSFHVGVHLRLIQFLYAHLPVNISTSPNDIEPTSIHLTNFNTRKSTLHKASIDWL